MGEAQRAVLDSRSTRIDEQVTAGDAHVNSTGTDVHGHITRTQEEELDVVDLVGQNEFTPATALAVSGLHEHLARGIGEGTLVGYSNAKHENPRGSGRRLEG